MRKVVALIPVLLVLALFASTVYADDSITYSINDWHIHAAVNQDGSMNVKEYITYKVSPEHEGPVKRDINISRASYMDELSVSVVTTVDPRILPDRKLNRISLLTILAARRRNICSTARSQC